MASTSVCGMIKTIITCRGHQIKICTKVKNKCIELSSLLETVISKLKNIYSPSVGALKYLCKKEGGSIKCEGTATWLRLYTPNVFSSYKWMRSYYL